MPTFLPLLLVPMLLVACGDSLSLPDTSVEAPQPSVTLVPVDSLQLASRVTRFLLEPSISSDAKLQLFEGTLSSYHLRRIASADLPNTLLEREISLFVVGRDDQTVAVPEQLLVPGLVYSLTLAGAILAEVTVDPEDADRDLLRRIWPPNSAAAEPMGIYCAAEPRAPMRGHWPLLPYGQAVGVAGVSAGVAEDRCVRIVATEAVQTGSTLVIPPRVDGADMDPTPWRIAASPPTVSSPCVPPSVAMGPVCAQVLDDRLLLESSVQQLLALRGEESNWFGVVGALPTVAKLLLPGTDNSVEMTSFDASGRFWEQRMVVHSMAAVQRAVINEVMANPNGPEPQQEWVELFNDGQIPTDLGGYILEDTGGKSELPSFVLDVGRFVLIVSESFDAASPFDIQPAAGTAMLRVPVLALNGIRNSGEPLLLRAPSGEVVSRAPALASPDGVSIARKEPSLPDVLEAFVLHDTPGASPGSENSVTSDTQ